MFYATGLPGWLRFGGNDQQTLKNRADALQSELDIIKKHLSETGTGGGAE